MAALRAIAVAALGIVALTGTAVAGLEKALTPPDAGYGHAALPVAAAPPAAASPPVPAAPAPSGSPPGLAAGPGQAARPPCAPPVRICVQLSGSAAWLLTPEGTRLGPVPIRHGSPNSPTPSGVFPVESKDAAHVHSATGTPMPYAIFFAGNLALYEADLSRPSAGSVRLPPGAAEAFFREVSVGDLIQVVP